MCSKPSPASKSNPSRTPASNRWRASFSGASHCDGQFLGPILDVAADFLLAARGQDAAPVQDEDVFAERLQLGQNVAGDQDADAAGGQFLERLRHFLAAHRVEAVHRLVQHQQVRLVQQVPGPSLTRCFMPLEYWPMRLPQCFARQSHPVQNRLAARAAASSGARPARAGARPAQPIQRAQFLRHGFAFRAISDAPEQRRDCSKASGRRRSVAPELGLKLAGDDLDEGALARAVGADQTGQARLDLEADVVQPHDDAVPAAQLLRLDDRRSFGCDPLCDDRRRPAASISSQRQRARRPDAGCVQRVAWFVAGMLLQHVAQDRDVVLGGLEIVAQAESGQADLLADCN